MTIIRVVSLEDYGSSGVFSARRLRLSNFSLLSFALRLCLSACLPAKRSNSTQSPPHELFSKAILQDPTMRPSRGEWRGNRVGSRCGPPFSTCSVKTRSTFIGVVRVYGRRRERKRGESANNEERRAKVCLLRAERRNLTRRVLLPPFSKARGIGSVALGNDSRYSSSSSSLFFILYSYRARLPLRYEIGDFDSSTRRPNESV